MPDHPILLYHFDPSRSRWVPIRLLGGFSGYLQTEGHEGYANVCTEQVLVAVGCWAHARGKFDEALKAQQLPSAEKQKKSLAAVALAKIQAFYRIERDIKFCDTVAGANASANLFSLIETARANGTEPYAYLKTVFTELPNATSVEANEALLPVPAGDENLAKVS